MPMIRIELLVLGLWAVFYTYWLISAAQAKRSVKKSRGCATVRVLAIVIIVLLLRSSREFRQAVTRIPSSPLPVLGLVFCALGLGLAVWARRHIGRNWGMPMSLKEDPELVTSGPYRYIRHPIYSGILLGMLASSLAGGLIWLLLAVVFGTIFAIAARAEERLMLQQFPEQYAQYRARTKAMIPFIW